MTASPVDQSQAPIFIVGSGRCGTTLLRMMLITNSRIMIPEECDFLWRAAASLPVRERLDARALDRFVDLLNGISSFPALGMAPGDLRQDLARRRPETLVDAIEHVYASYAQRHGRSRWGDKNPFYVLYLDLVVSLFPAARIVHVIRDARDVALSYSKTRMRPHNVYLTAVRWTQCIDRGQAWGAAHPAQYLETRYEDLIARPECELTRVCRFVGEPYDPRMLEFQGNPLEFVSDNNRDHHLNLTRPVMRTNKEKWREQMSPTDIAIVEHVAGGALRRLGYPLANLPVPSWLTGYLKTCALRYAVGRQAPVRRIASGPLFWRARKLVKRLALIDNAHYRWPP